MNKYCEYFKTVKGNRDSYFELVLNYFQGKPIKILEIGSARNLDFGGRQGDGWSSIHFYNYIKANGGSLKIVDIDHRAIENCKQLLENYSADVSFEVADGIDFINDSYDLIYLDGGDDPVDMVKQYQKISSKTIVLCDDFSTKGSVLRTAFPKFRLLKWVGNPHEMAIYNMQDFYSEQIVECIQ
jgi:predicted O-methyltransferase YrrM